MRVHGLQNLNRIARSIRPPIDTAADLGFSNLRSRALALASEKHEREVACWRWLLEGSA
jgi:hypothetical protein